MENMKRVLSGFLALVLILGMLPGVPMVAGAEEVEPQPEILAEETAAAETETEAAETVAETEAPETVPEEETVPAETVEETLPQETVAEEPVIEETVPEVSEEAADANDIVVPVQKVVISASKERTYVGDIVKLNAVISPSNATEAKVNWIIDGGSYTLRDNAMRAEEAGIFTICAEVEGADIEIEPIEVEFVNYKMELNEAPIADENIFEGQYILQTGDSMPISVKYLTWGADESESDAKVELPLHTPSVKWTMSIVDPNTGATTGDDVTKYISWEESADTKEITLTAKLVTEYKYILVTAKEMLADKVLGESSILIRLYPDSYKLYITDENGKDVTNGTIVLDLANDETEVTLNAYVWPVEGDEDLVWSTSDTLVELEDLDGKEETANKSMRVIADPRSGETVITVQGAEHPGVCATVTIKRMRLIQAIGPTKETEDLQTKELMVGQSAKLQAVDLADREILDSTKVKWELAEGDEAYATLSAEGVLKAQNVSVGKVITVRCSVIDNEDDAYFELYIPIRPKATAVKILADTFMGETLSPCALVEGEVLNGKTVTVDTEDYVRAVPNFVVENFEYDYSGAGDPVGAKQEVTWKSSNTSVAAFDPLTDELVWKGKNGTTTITATAADGSGKSASVTLKFGTKLREIWFNEEPGMFLRSGASWTFDLGYYPEKASNKDVNWYVSHITSGMELANASSIATISSSGKLTAKTVYDNQLVLVTAASKEDETICASFEVLIRPKKDYALTLLDEDGNCVTKSTILLDVGQSVSLEAVLVGESLGEYYDAGAEWKTSSKAVAEVEDGYVTALKAGNATITATGQDGQKVTVTIKVVSKVDYIEVYQKNDICVLGSGKSLDLKADVYDFDTATEKNPKGKPGVSKVNWYIDGPHQQYATVNASGKVTAVKGYTGEPVDIDVYAVATDGSGVWSAPYTVTIYPVVESMRIDIDASPSTTRSYTYYMVESGEYVGQLTAVTFPENASDDVTWKSSNKTIAEVDEDGNVIAYKPGTVTITATADDGSGKKATFKLTIVTKIAYVGLDNEKNMIFDENRGEWLLVIAGGKSLTVKPVLFDANGKKMNVAVEWEMGKIYDDYGTAFVKSFSKGTLVTEKVTEPKFTTVTIKLPGKYADGTVGIAGEDGFVRLTVTVGVYPATTSMKILDPNGVAKTSIWAKAAADTEIDLDVLTNPNAAQGWTWTTSNKNLAVVDENGVVTCVAQKDGSYKAGTVTITATAKDGTGKKATVKIEFHK